MSGGTRPTAPARPSPWVVLPRPNPGARLRLFCFPYAGGGASIFAPWGRMLPAEVEVVAVQLPGRENRIGERAIADMGELAPKMAEELARFMESGGALDEHLGDQILLPAALLAAGKLGPASPGTTRYTTARVTEHLTTHAWLIEHFLPVRVTVEPGGAVEVAPAPVTGPTPP